MRKAQITVARLLFALPLLAILMQAAPAQQLAVDSADPGEIQKRIEQRPKPQPKRAPELPTAPAVEKEAEPLGEEGFVLAAVVIEGATVFDATDFGPLYEKLLGHELQMADVEALLARITQLYRDEGYFLSRAIAPPQDLSAGLLTIRVIEGWVERIRFEGEAERVGELGMYQRRLAAQRPLTLAKLERTILLINDLPGVSVEPNLEPLDEAGERYELVLETSYDPADGYFFTDNRGTPAVGRFQSWLSGGLNSPLGLRERLQFGIFTVPNQPEELVYLEGVWEQPLDNEGTTASVTVSRSWVDAGAELAEQDTESRSEAYSFKIWHPIIRSRTHNLWLTASFDYIDLVEDRFGTELVDDSLRVIRGRLNHMIGDGLDGTTYTSVEVSQGLDMMGASLPGDPRLSRPDGSGQFTKFQANVTRVQQLPWNFGVTLAMAGQVASRELLSSEEFAIGGSQFGRAYDIAELSGEDGFAASAEVNWSYDLNLDFLQSVQIYGFYDWAAVWNQQPGDTRTRDSLSSAGGGLRFTILPELSVSLEVAVPLTRRVFTTDERDPRLFFSVSSSF